MARHANSTTRASILDSPDITGEPALIILARALSSAPSAVQALQQHLTAEGAEDAEDSRRAVAQRGSPPSLPHRTSLVAPEITGEPATERLEGAGRRSRPRTLHQLRWPALVPSRRVKERCPLVARGHGGPFRTVATPRINPIGCVSSPSQLTLQPRSPRASAPRRRNPPLNGQADRRNTARGYASALRARKLFGSFSSTVTSHPR
jgi:hypothetical protein